MTIAEIEALARDQTIIEAKERGQGSHYRELDNHNQPSNMSHTKTSQHHPKDPHQEGHIELTQKHLPHNQEDVTKDGVTCDKYRGTGKKQERVSSAADPRVAQKDLDWKVPKVSGGSKRLKKRTSLE